LSGISATIASVSSTSGGREFGEWEVRSDARVGARFHFRAGIPSLVPWLVVSGATASGSV
jgi:hypothetical protein